MPSYAAIDPVETVTPPIFHPSEHRSFAGGPGWVVSRANWSCCNFNSTLISIQPEPGLLLLQVDGLVLVAVDGVANLGRGLAEPGHPIGKETLLAQWEHSVACADS